MVLKIYCSELFSFSSESFLRSSCFSFFLSPRLPPLAALKQSDEGSRTLKKIARRAGSRRTQGTTGGSSSRAPVGGSWIPQSPMHTGSQGTTGEQAFSQAVPAGG